MDGLRTPAHPADAWPDYNRPQELEQTRPRQHRLRDRQAEGLCGLEIDHELKLRNLFDGKVNKYTYPPKNDRLGAYSQVEEFEL